jgi:hypothetical protein
MISSKPALRIVNGIPTSTPFAKAGIPDRSPPLCRSLTASSNGSSDAPHLGCNSIAKGNLSLPDQAADCLDHLRAASKMRRQKDQRVLLGIVPSKSEKIWTGFELTGHPLSQHLPEPENELLIGRAHVFAYVAEEEI